ncbi:MAG: HemK family protein methyltransferase [Eubacteriales bacterium]|nr:HemK family protein methyltransferase [Eubacteriales bacterium]
MEKEIKYIPFKKAYKDLIIYGKEKQFDNIETLRWIIVKSLRLRREQFDSIYQVDEYSYDTMKKAIDRYAKGESLSKIFGFIEFCGNFFDVTDNVFDPRLSTECLVKAVVDKYKGKDIKVIDLCTGSGSVAVTLSLQLGIKVDGIDISPFAVETATLNNKKLGGQAQFFIMDLNENWDKYLTKKYDVIVSNPPYWNAEKILENVDVVKNNPIIGFDGGEDGLYYIKNIIDNAPKFLNPNGQLYLECDPDQMEKIKSYLSDNFDSITEYKDYRDISRVLGATLKKQ